LRKEMSCWGQFLWERGNENGKGRKEKKIAVKGGR